MAKPAKHGNAWRARWVDEHGRRQSKTFAEYEDADVFLVTKEADVVQIKYD